jgi:hypothetical protein
VVPTGGFTVKGRESVGELENILHGIVFIAERETGVSILWIIVIGIILTIIIALVFDSTQGRGRRYRRGYRVGYTEELGKQRARARVKRETEKNK